MTAPNFPRIFYGGDYNPDQWPEELWQEDMRLFKLAGVSILTLPVFSWARLQPSEDEFNFDWLDRVIGLAWENGIRICLATPTAAQPAWMSHRYPEVLPVDTYGRKRTYGGRVNFCPNSPVFRSFAAEIAGKMAERYAKHPALTVWHIGNEYIPGCYCENCAKGFREWLKTNYGTIDEANRRWNSGFWGHTFYSWEEVAAPSRLNGDDEAFQGIALDYRRFMSDSYLECYKTELDAIRRYSPDIPATANFMYQFKPLDYFKWAKYLDIISWDSYPGLKDNISDFAFWHDVMRGLKDGQPFMLMEQAPGHVNWQAVCSVKRPGVMRLWSYQAVARGADTVMFFQMRQSRGAAEMHHSALISHEGSENTRVFKECAQLGRELQSLGDRLTGGRSCNRAAILMDWENWWALELTQGPTRELKYMDQLLKYYRELYKSNISIDVISPESDFSGYDVIFAPALYMVRTELARKLETFTAGGGIFVTNFYSGIVDESDLVTLGGYPGELRKLLGIWVEENDALWPDMSNSMVITAPFGGIKGSYSCKMLCDILHLEGAKALALFGSDFYAGSPAVTENSYGKGKAYYVATDPEEDFLSAFLKEICTRAGVKAAMENLPAGIEVCRRCKEGKVYTFLLNHNNSAAAVDVGSECRKELLSGRELYGEVVMEAKGVMILEDGK